MFAQDFVRPDLDYHAFLPELVLVGVLVLILLVDLFTEEGNKWSIATITGIGLLGTAVPLLTLAVDGTDRIMFDGAYVVDDFSLVMKALFVLSGYLVVLMSSHYVSEGDYYEGEYYFLLLSALLGMVVMASARDLVTIFVALELLSIPGYLLAAWRKRDLKGNEAGLKYYLMGVFASAVMLYGMSLIYGVSGSTVLVEIGEAVGGSAGSEPIVTVGILFVIVGFAFKVSAVPFHTWAPDTYEGAPTPITAFLAVASKAAGFVALLQLIFIGFFGRDDVWEPAIWALAALTMTVGNLVALRQTNVVRLLAYSSIAQAGFMLAPLAVASDDPSAALTAVVTYLLIYAVMNLGAFAVVITVARKTASAQVESFNGLFEYAPGLAVAMTAFLFALAGIPPLGGWVAKFVVFRALLAPGTFSGAALAVIVGVNSVIAIGYYARVARHMWMEPADDPEAEIAVPPALAVSLGLCAAATLLFGVVPGTITRFGDLATFALG